MFKDDTVFVVGAGASKEANLPVGPELANLIAESMKFSFEWGGFKDGDISTFEAWKRYFPEIAVLNQYLEGAAQIANGITLANSIDNYMYIHRDNDHIQFCGKYAITRAILKAERSSPLYLDLRDGDSLDVSRMKDTWYSQFAETLFEGRQKSDLENVFAGIKIVCFNYDRCIEHYLTHALVSLYAISKSDAEEIIESLEIYHPYGSVGRLRSDRRPNGVVFGGSGDSDRQIEISKSIRTYNEEIDDSSEVDSVKNAIASAQNLIFLGFGFHRQNMELLEPATTGQIIRVLATAYGLSRENCDEVRRRIAPLNKSRASTENTLVLNDVTCVELFRRFRMSL